MYPEINIGNLTIYSYSLMIAIGVIFGMIYAYFFVIKSERISGSTTLRLLLVFIVGGISMYLGALFFDSLFHSIEEGTFVFGGITWLGGVVTSFPITILLIHKFVPVAKGRALYTLSIFIPSIVLAHAFGRVGCFLAGCCYGKETTSVLGVIFPGMTTPHLPTQLFEALFEFLLFIFMVLVKKKYKGHELEIYLYFYSVFRFIIEFYRGDDRGSSGFFLSPAQVLDILCLVSAVLISLFYRQKVFKKLYAKCLIWIDEVERNYSKKKNYIEIIQSPESKIRELFEMKEKGIITEDEFIKKKTQLLKKI